jgi:hypothetical protein
MKGTGKFPIQKCAIFRKFKEIKELRGGILLYAAQAIPPIDAEIAEKSHLWAETSYCCSYLASAYMTSGLNAVIFSTILMWNIINLRIFMRQPVAWRAFYGGILGPQKKIIPHLAYLLARLLRYIHRHVSRYAPLDVPCRRTQIRRNLVELFLTVTLRSHRNLHCILA